MKWLNVFLGNYKYFRKWNYGFWESLILADSITRQPNPFHMRFECMKKDSDTKQKGSEQPETKVGLDDKRTQQKKEQDAKDGITDRVMEHQSKDHEVQRT